MSKSKCPIGLSTCMSFLKGESFNPLGMLSFGNELLLRFLWSIGVHKGQEIYLFRSMFVGLACRSGVSVWRVGLACRSSVSVRFVGSLIS